MQAAAAACGGLWDIMESSGNCRVIYDFDHTESRVGTGAIKYDAERRGKNPELTPLWVADMDFRAPQPIIDALQTRVAHGVFGYTDPTDSYLASVCDWISARQGWRPRPEWITVTPGVVYALACAVRAYTRPGDAVLIQQPVYYPFSEVVRDNGRRLANCSLLYEDGSYSIDFDAFERTIVAEGVRLFLLCNPHNPGGRVWTREELTRIARICRAHGVVVLSDEIHADFVRPGYEHVSFASLGQGLGARCVVCTSPSKAFNLAGLQVSNIIVPDAGLREQFRRENAASGYSQANVMGLVACEAAYRECGEWLDQLKVYLEGNREVLAGLLAERAPELHLVENGSTYLAWIDCRALGLSDEALTHLVEDGAGLWLDMGDVFGPDGSGFVRLNYACPRATLTDAVARLCNAVTELESARTRCPILRLVA